MLKGFQRKYLRGLAHAYKPVVLIGQKGISESLSESFEDALNSHELIKVKFVDFKEKEQKKELIEELEKTAACEMVGMTGHIAIFFRQNRIPEKRKISIPEEKK
ncbi:MAG: YhbY family RNA-binding protein [Pseudomonadota bacterium]|nr:YhbY family RNA-binding protein [Pseudomonadota bacterium]